MDVRSIDKSRLKGFFKTTGFPSCLLVVNVALAALVKELFSISLNPFAANITDTF